MSLGGTLQVVLLAPFTPTVGASFDILDWSDLSGEFSSLMLPALSGGLTWDASQRYASGVLSVAPPAAGDFDEDVDVDADDLARWNLGFGTLAAATHLQGDANADGAVEGADFMVWQRQLGTSVGVLQTTAVPEQESSLLLLPATAGAIAIVRRQRAKEVSVLIHT